ncbi:MAG: HAD-IIIA family hydrolase [Lachnospiraceae bacterium]|nr:HAD-IIIA family hydrolase [Lachnospiraceae bacterium]
MGYLADQVQEELGNGEEFHLHIAYDITPPEYDTGDRLVHAKALLKEAFLLLYCDNYCPIDFSKLSESFFANQAMIQLTAYSNKDGYTKNNLRLAAESDLIEIYDKSRKADNLKGVDIGYALVNKKVIEALPAMPGNFAKACYETLCRDGKLFATMTDHRYYSIGSFDRMNLTEDFFKHKKAVFLDRDGTLNVRPPRACYVKTPEEFIWLPGAKEAVRLFNDRGYLVFLVSNQPGIARGEMTLADLETVNAKMEKELAEEKAHIDKIYFCPHGWDEGCDCRKPNPGMLYQAQREYSLDLPHDCVLFGDDERDIQAGEAARVPSFLITEEHSLLDAAKQYLNKEII